jgi:hypothetical protein
VTSASAGRKSPFSRPRSGLLEHGVMMIVEGNLGWPEDGGPASMGLP